MMTGQSRPTMCHLVVLTFFLLACHCLSAEEPLRVVFGGLGRSGSHSLATALRRLGYHTCHGSDIFTSLQSTHKRLSDAMMEDNLTAILKETSVLGYNATLEVHSGWWREIWDRTTDRDTKFIFTIRDFDSWFESFVLMRHSTAPMFRYPLRFLFEPQRKWVSSLAMRRFNLPDDDKASSDCLLRPETLRSEHQKVHERDIEDALEMTRHHPDRALLFDLKSHGYPELCHFLNIPKTQCPNVPFPHLGQGQRLRNFGRVLRSVEAVLYVFPLLVVGLLVWRRSCRKPDRKAKTT